MSESSETLRLIENLIRIGTVTETKSQDGKALARVIIDERVSTFFPVLQNVNSFKRKYSPVRVGEQVVVLSPYGNGDFGVILGSIFNKNEKEPQNADNNTEISAYEDGTEISYNTKEKLLHVKLAKDTKIEVVANANITIGGNATISVNGNTDVKCRQTTYSGVVIVGSLVVGGATGSKVTSSGGVLTIDDSVMFKGEATVTGSMSVEGNINDSKGDLTNHTNNGLSRD